MLKIANIDKSSDITTKECKNCIHHIGVKSIDDAPEVCWHCSSSKEDKPHFTHTNAVLNK